MTLTPKEERFFKKLDDFWENAPELLKAFVYLFVGGLGGLVLYFSVQGFVKSSIYTYISGGYQTDYKCPTEYDTKEEYLESLATYTTNALKKNPNTTEEELFQKRAGWFASMKCEKGHWTDTKSYQTYVNDELGFSFQYPSYLFLEKDLDIDTRLIMFPKSLKSNETEPFTAIIIDIYESDNVSLLDWLKSPDSNYDILDGGYDMLIVGGQEAVSIDHGLWIIFNSPDQKKRISISPLIDLRNGAVPLYNEIDKIVDSFSFY